jgi:glucose-1-phosphate adenylyltransferase
VSCIEVPISIASAFGLVAIDEVGRVLDFVEKPEYPPSLPGRDDLALASMGIYLFEASFLFDELRRDAADATSSHDFGRDILPRLTSSGRLWAHQFSDSCIINEGVAELYWRDVGTVDAYWEANVDLTQVVPRLDLYDKRWPVRSLHERRPAAKFVFDDDGRRGQALSSLVSAGCIVSGGTVRRSLLGPDVRVDSHALIEDSIVHQGSRVHRHCRLRRVIIDEGCEIPEGTVIGEVVEEDERRFYRSPGGVTLVTRDMLARLEG